ncbi:MAG: hypothetical protein WCK67_00725 [bacterium]
MNEVNFDHTSIVLRDGRVLVIAGAQCDVIEIYDPKTETFKTVKYRYRRQDAAASIMQDGKVLISGGNDEIYNKILKQRERFTDTEIFDPKTDELKPAAKMNYYKYVSKSILLNDGRVFIEGYSMAEIYDPVKDKFDYIDNKIEEITDKYIDIFKLKDGKVLMIGDIGGYGPHTDFNKTFGIFDPETNTVILYKDKIKMPFNGNYAAVLLNDGETLAVIGGYNEACHVLKTISLYNIYKIINNIQE